VRWTEARSEDIRRELRLPGTVEARHKAVIASEVAGRLIERSVRAGQHVKAGQVLARLEDGDLKFRLESARGQLGEAEARRIRADHTLTRAKDLFGRNLASSAELDEANAEFRAWEGRVAQWTAEIGRIELDLDRCTIEAPFAGIVVREIAEAGEWLAVGGPVVELLSLDDLEVRVEVAEQHFPRVRVGDRAQVSFSALDGMTVEGRIVARIPNADPRARTFPILVSVPNPEHRIGVGMLAEAKLPLGAGKTAVLVPKDAIVRNGQDQFVWVVDDSAMVQRITIEVGEGHGAWIVAQDGVAAGQRVVTRGNERLFPGQRVVGEPLEYELP
jgi:RND family efflux transporter MFP subunit